MAGELSLQSAEGRKNHVFISPVDDRQELVKKIHRDIGHFGIHRMLDRLKRNYWWKGMEDTVKDVLKACVPCARTKAGFRVSGTELQPPKMQGVDLTDQSTEFQG